MESRQRMVIIRIVSIPASTRKKPGVKRHKSTLYAILFESRSIAFGIRLLRDLILSLAVVNIALVLLVGRIPCCIFRFSIGSFN